MWRILGVDPNDDRVAEAESARRKFVRESEEMFALDFVGVEEVEGEESETNVDSSSSSDD